MKFQMNKRLAMERKRRLVFIIAGLFLAIVTFYFVQLWWVSLIVLIAIPALLELFFYARAKLAQSARIHLIESVFPDFLQLMASNLRAGMTIDRALLLSARKEFAPLDQEIIQVGKDLVTGKDIAAALRELALRINSEKIRKTVYLINTGITSGGNLAILLEETSVSMRERMFVEKRAASNVLMYVIFIFFAVAIGAPALFGLSTVLVEILTNLLSTIPAIEVEAANLPFTLTSVNVPVEFITYYSIVFLLAMSILGSFVLGLVSKGEERAGFRYLLPITGLSLTIFLIVRFALARQFGSLFGG